MAQQQITIGVSIAWWLRWYLSGVALMCKMSGGEPRLDRVAYWVGRSIRMRIDRRA
jgi:hypothetical protein